MRNDPLICRFDMDIPQPIAVVIPCYKVCDHILTLLKQIPDFIDRIYVVDDACPDQSGQFVLDHQADPRVEVIVHDHNQGVGGAVMTGYQAAMRDHMMIVVKVDGDGQMDPALIPDFVEPILMGEADYTKGNRFYDLEDVQAMPRIRLLGNAGLSLLNKLSSGYWHLFDPTNGYTAIHVDVLRRLPFAKISQRYFFETDMLFRLNTLRAVVHDVPMTAHYGDEVSHLNIRKIFGEFLIKHLRNLGKRIFYNYYLRDVSLASIELPVGLGLLLFGACFGSAHWYHSVSTGQATPTGTVMLAALPIIVGVQFIMAFIGHDVASVPQRPLHRRLFGMLRKGQ